MSIKNVPEYLIPNVDELIAEMDGYVGTVNDEIIRQNEIRIMQHRREWGCDPFVTDITREDIIMARRYLNTVETWEGWDRNAYSRES